MTDKRRATVDAVLARRQPDLTVLAERLHKPRNFSAIVRTCDAVGVNEVHAVPGEEGLAIHWNTSQGAEKWMNVRPHEDLASACRHLRKRGFQLVAAHLSDQARDYREIDYTTPTALVVGTELFGVSEEALAESDCQVMIPMKGMTQSLNVSVACAIVLYEAMRQRDEKGLYAESRLDGETCRIQRFEWLHPVVARFCRERGLEYPEIDEAGNVTGSFPRSA
ncbi:MAG: tRNA (guanosine(18)-2'-O)-methyltransferase TrmH [Xanthomonadales bacterium]|jgi:tRNA (guanosine-2'-O-)-methyltransferase|nr:tRNA (guanosine(18)-2'-O)-methyltransferase TrmH [Xanthomonadales bacterium]